AFAVATVLCLVLLVLLHRSRHRLRQLEARLPALSDAMSRYLHTEGQRCRELLRNNGMADTQRLLVSLRHRWLSAELAALREAGTAAADDQILAERLAPLVKALQTPAPQLEPAVDQRLEA